MDENLEGEMRYVCGVMRPVTFGFMIMWIWNYFLIRNLSTECHEERLSQGEVARRFGCRFCSAATLGQWSSSWGFAKR